MHAHPPIIPKIPPRGGLDATQRRPPGPQEGLPNRYHNWKPEPRASGPGDSGPPWRGVVYEGGGWFLDGVRRTPGQSRRAGIPPFHQRWLSSGSVIVVKREVNESVHLNLSDDSEAHGLLKCGAVAGWHTATKSVKRSVNHREMHIIMYDQNVGLARTNLILQTETSLSETGGALTPCDRCKMSFGCCDEHWSVVRALHQAPCPIIRGPYPNIQHCADEGQEKHFMWRIIRPQAEWSALRNRTWEHVIGGDVSSAAAGTAFEHHVPACTRRISSLASTAFTILYALEHLNTSTAWTEKSELVINILVGSPLEFTEGGDLYEAILHRAPKVKKVIFYFFLPTPIPGMLSQHSTRRGIFNHVILTKTFEAFVHNEAELFVQPDLFIATNSAFLAQTNPPSGAAQSRSSSHGTSQVSSRHSRAALRNPGRQLCASPARSSFRPQRGEESIWQHEDDTELSVVHGFHAPNAWFTGGFR
ncbi:hypothetical protein B0H13DRAFT_1871352 [Mycena leptocephala]|nr:hypothetical protein B0H13DRAFT_1871352 [Mycena leptocephala]